MPPLPAPIYLLPQVHSLPNDSKIRVLGLIQEYDPTTAHILLHHRPSFSPAPSRKRKLPNDSKDHKNKKKKRIKIISGIGSVVAKPATETNIGDTPTSAPLITKPVVPITPLPQSEDPEHTLLVSISALLESPGSLLNNSLPEVQEGFWVNVIGYKRGDGVIDAITLSRVKGKLDIQEYEKVISGMAAIRQEIEKNKKKD